MAVPASYNDIAADPAVRDHIGEVWYQTTVRVPRGWDGRRIVLHFESATHRATVWVDDVEVVSHEGGYTPFEADVTEHVAGRRAGADHRGGQQHADLPDDPARASSRTPRTASGSATGTTSSTTPASTARCGCTATAPAHLTDITVVTGLDGADGTVEYRVEAADADGAEVRVVLRDADGVEVATGSGASGTLTVPDVHRWAPGDGYLYDLEVQLVDGTGTLLDSYHQSVGVRTVAVRRHPVPHQRRAVPLHRLRHARGPRRRSARATTTRLMLHDFALLEWIGANSFRTSHYPYSRGRAGLRRPPRHRGHRRDRRRSG